jgi:hypothetical protein
MFRTVVFVLFFTLPLSVLAQQPSSRSMDDLNWKEFQQLVPAKVKTVILTVGTLEAHGFINNGADNTVPVAIANAIAGDVNALIAPHIPYGVTDILAPYPGSLHIPEEAFRIYVRAVLVDRGARRIESSNAAEKHTIIKYTNLNDKGISPGPASNGPSKPGSRSGFRSNVSFDEQPILAPRASITAHANEPGPSFSGPWPLDGAKKTIRGSSEGCMKT